MKQQMFAIYDSATVAYMQPWFAATEQEAVRGFSLAANDKTHPIGQTPSDYTLMRVGTWDPKEGVVEPQRPEHIARAIDQVRQMQHDNQMHMFEDPRMNMSADQLIAGEDEAEKYDRVVNGADGANPGDL